MKHQLHLTVITFLLASFTMFSQSNYWTSIKTNELRGSHNLENFDTKQIQTYSLNIEAFKQTLGSAPMRGVAGRSNTIVSFPNQFGKFTDYRVVELPIMSAELAAQFPNIKAYLGFDVANPVNRIRFTVTPQGVQTMASGTEGELTFVVPLDKYGTNQYIAYSRASKLNAVKEFEARLMKCSAFL